VIVEVHPDPDNAMSDGAQSLDLPTFARLAAQIKGVTPARPLRPRPVAPKLMA
jgi:3-deoxy-7-phosphoheptulonate synthase